MKEIVSLVSCGDQDEDEDEEEEDEEEEEEEEEPIWTSPEPTGSKKCFDK